MTGKIDPVQYQLGKARFKAGGTALEIVKLFHEADAKQNSDDAPMSFGLGFLDAALDKLRGLER